MAGRAGGWSGVRSRAPRRVLLGVGVVSRSVAALSLVTFTLALAPALARAAAPVPGGEYVTNVTAEDATLGGEVNPEGEVTSYSFQYGTSEAYGRQTPLETLPAADNALHAVFATVEHLEPGTVYYYRLTATSTAGTAYGLGKTFTTQPPVGPLALPDRRQYELVSPAEKDGAQIFGIVAKNGVAIGGSGAVQASEDGSKITYLASASVGSDPVGSVAATQVLSGRAPNNEGREEWSSQDISPAHAYPVGTLPLNLGEPYRYFSNTLSQGVLQENGGLGTPVELRDDKSGVLQSLPTGGLPSPVSFDAATPDLQHIVVGTSEEATAGVYEWPGAGETASEAPVQANILESGEPGSEDFLGGFPTGSAERTSEFAGRHAVSNDGSRIVWGNSQELFTRDMLSKETKRVDAAEPGCGSCVGGEGLFQLASGDGTRVFFTDAREVTSGAVAGTWEGEPAGSLFMYDITEGKVRDLTAAGGVVDVLGANEEGTIVYVVSASVLTTEQNPHHEEAVEGDLNIFMLRETGKGAWGTAFVATLAASDKQAYYTVASTPHNLAKWPVRVSGNGEYLAFMSAARLTGYDNRDVVSGVPDEEVFLYGARAGSLACASCDPSGARPVGELDTGVYPGLPMDPVKTWAGHWLAAAIPGWNEALSSGDTYGFDSPLHASRVLSDSGRLFFDSADALVPEDVNSREDVYEYEPGGEGSCGVGVVGCVALISSGRGDDDSDFVDASVSGDDVFFTTSDQLVAADKDTTRDIYDASVCGTAESHPCLTESAVASVACSSAEACRVPQTPQPGAFGASASETFSGPGNLLPALVPTKPEVRSLTRAQKLAVALGACRHKRKGRARVLCERQARARYGVAKKAKKAGGKRRAHR
jgi:hypothetical protein